MTHADTNKDSVVINIYNLLLNNDNLQEFYLSNNIQLHRRTTKSKQVYYELTINDISIGRLDRTGANQYQEYSYIQSVTTFSFAGIKSHNESKDILMTKVINELIEMLQTCSLPFNLTKLHIAKDITCKSINNILAMRTNRTGMTQRLNSPFNIYKKTSFYIENKDIKDPSLKGIVYDKTKKEKDKHHNIIAADIFRLEVGIQNLKRKDFTSASQLLEHIQKQLDKYLFVHFTDINKCNILKKDYEKMVRRKTSKPSSSFMEKIKEFGGVIINNQLSDKTIEFINMCFCEDIERKIFNNYIEGYEDHHLNDFMTNTSLERRLKMGKYKKNKIFMAALRRRNRQEKGLTEKPNGRELFKRK